MVVVVVVVVVVREVGGGGEVTLFRHEKLPPLARNNKHSRLLTHI